MNSNWQKIKLSDVCEVIGGGTPSTKNYDFWNGDIPWLTPKDLSGYNSRYISKGERNIAQEGLQNSSAHMLPKGSVLLTSRAPIGYVAIAKNDVCTNQGFKSLVLKKGYCSEFFYYLLKNNIEYIVGMGSGSTFAEISGTQVKNLEFTVPPLDIQKKIARVLGVLDDKIELNNRINNNLEQQAQALFKSIYGSENNGILADIVNIAESGSRPKGGALSQGIPSIGAENIEKFGVYDYSKEKFISEEFYKQMKRGKVLSEDVLLYKDGAYTGKVSLALDGFPHKVCAVNEHVFIIRGKSNISSQFFIYFCLSYETNKNYLHTLACSKAAQPGLNQSELLGLPIFIPLPDTVKKFTNIVSPLMHKIAANALENIKLASIRDTLLPKLMSGEINVDNVDISEQKDTP